ncbi:hypothetical protein PR001_g8943 [Phytophthora rubi]|uniref:DUF659 domain-containing protein n=1 Tax=Phytophthora rubi TaxID=129364 RepID=A0A6A3MXT0_9STRA|nr:hypothetical protein PR001_g8943 [Phytophthora rubi]
MIKQDATALIESGLAPWQVVKAVKMYLYLRVEYTLRHLHPEDQHINGFDDHLRRGHRHLLRLPKDAKNELQSGILASFWPRCRRHAGCPPGGRVANSGDPTRRGGRLQDPVWNDVLISDGVVSCKKCEKIIHTSGKTHVERVRYHFAKKCPKRAYTPAITTCFRPAISPVKVAAFQRKFALWFYSTRMAFNKAAHHTLVAALGELTPTNVVPSRKQLASTLMKTCYEEARATVMHKLRDRNCTLVTDAWMDVNGKSVVNYSMDVNGKSVVNYVALDEELVVFLAGSTSHDAAFLAADIRRVIAKYPFIRFFAVVTDNTAANQLVWATLQKEYQRMFFHSCISHALHLVVKDFVRQLPWLQKLEQDCRQLVRFLKKSQ